MTRTLEEHPVNGLVGYDLAIDEDRSAIMAMMRFRSERDFKLFEKATGAILNERMQNLLRVDIQQGVEFKGLYITGK